MLKDCFKPCSSTPEPLLRRPSIQVAPFFFHFNFSNALPTSIPASLLHQLTESIAGTTWASKKKTFFITFK